MSEEIPGEAEAAQELASLRQQNLEQRHSELASAVQAYGAAKAEVMGFQSAYVTTWAMYGEFISTELVQHNATVGFTAVPEDQATSTTRGLFEFGSEAFNRLVVRAES